MHLNEFRNQTLIMFSVQNPYTHTQQIHASCMPSCINVGHVSLELFGLDCSVRFGYSLEKKMQQAH